MRQSDANQENDKSRSSNEDLLECIKRYESEKHELAKNLDEVYWKLAALEGTQLLLSCEAVELRAQNEKKALQLLQTESRAQSLQEELATLNGSNKKFAADLREMQTRFTTEVKEQDHMQLEIHKTSIEKDQYCRSNDDLRKSIKRCEDEKLEHALHLDEARKKFSEQEDAMTDFDREKITLETRSRDMEQWFGQITDNLQQENHQLQLCLDEARKKLSLLEASETQTQLECEIANLRAQNDELQSQLLQVPALQAEVTQYSTLNQQLEENHKTLQERLNSETEERELLKQDTNHENILKQGYYESNNKLRDSVKRLKDDKREQSRALVKAQEKLFRLEKSRRQLEGQKLLEAAYEAAMQKEIAELRDSKHQLEKMREELQTRLDSEAEEFERLLEEKNRTVIEKDSYCQSSKELSELVNRLESENKEQSRALDNFQRYLSPLDLKRIQLAGELKRLQFHILGLERKLMETSFISNSLKGRTTQLGALNEQNQSEITMLRTRLHDEAIEKERLMHENQVIKIKNDSYLSLNEDLREMMKRCGDKKREHIRRLNETLQKFSEQASETAELQTENAELQRQLLQKTALQEDVAKLSGFTVELEAEKRELEVKVLLRNTKGGDSEWVQQVGSERKEEGRRNLKNEVEFEVLPLPLNTEERQRERMQPDDRESQERVENNSNNDGKPGAQQLLPNIKEREREQEVHELKEQGRGNLSNNREPSAETPLLSFRERKNDCCNLKNKRNLEGQQLLVNAKEKDRGHVPQEYYELYELQVRENVKKQEDRGLKQQDNLTPTEDSATVLPPNRTEDSTEIDSKPLDLSLHLPERRLSCSQRIEQLEFYTSTCR